MTTLGELAARHQETSSFLAGRPREFVLLWYADRGVEIVPDGHVQHQCPTCNRTVSRAQEEFLELGSDQELRCSACSGVADRP